MAKIGGTHCGKNGWNSLRQKWVELYTTIRNTLIYKRNIGLKNDPLLNQNLEKTTKNIFTLETSFLLGAGK